MIDSLTRSLTLPSGDVMLYDEADQSVIGAHRWCVSPTRTNRYVKTNIALPDGRRTTAYLHRILLRVDRGQVVDHINHNGLDNRRVNLRAGSQGQNLANMGLLPQNTSGARGVCWDKQTNKWQAVIRVDGERRRLGRFTNFEAAEAAYCAAAVEAWGKWFAVREDGAA